MCKLPRREIADPGQQPELRRYHLCTPAKELLAAFWKLKKTEETLKRLTE